MVDVFRKIRLRCRWPTPGPFVLPLSQETRPSWMIRAGLLLYDRLAKRRSFPNSQTLSLRDDIAGHGLADRFTRAFRYVCGCAAIRVAR